MGWRWQLRKGSRKEVCPNCGQRRFVPYVSVADGETMAGAEYGRCDREDNCGYHRYPSGKSDGGIKPKEHPQLEPLRFYPAAVQVAFDTPLFYWACALVGYGNAIEAWNRYKVGKDGKRTVFWQIDKDGEIRSGKSIPYKMDGHRDKEDKYPANWLHRSPAWSSYKTGEELQQCFFGEHLLRESQTAPVAIVESEKTALILSVYSKRFVWLACGGSQGLKNEEKNKVLAGRRVILIPDNEQYWNWRGTADANGWEIRAEMEKYPVFEGCDILDMVEAGALGLDLLKNRMKYEN